MKNLRISARLWLAFSLIIGGTVLVGTVGLRRMAENEQQVGRLVDDLWGRVRLAQQVVALNNANARLSLTMLLVGDRSELDQLLAQQEDNRQKINNLFEKLEHLLEGTSDRREERLFAEVKSDRVKFVESFTRARKLLLADRRNEAARAAEHGRGFAVGASEVRKLSERSQTAAREISGVASTSVTIAEQSGARIARLVRLRGRCRPGSFPDEHASGAPPGGAARAGCGAAARLAGARGRRPRSPSPRASRR